mgnify:CR=1 FL=1
MSEDYAGLPKLKRDLRYLDCVLTDDELRQRGAKLAQVTTEIATEADHQKAVRDSQRSVMTALLAKQSELAAQINRGREVREVEVVTYADHARGLAMDVREDTGEVVLTRDLVGAERQQPLGFGTEEAPGPIDPL